MNEDADISNINLAAVLEDGIKIKIPTMQETEEINTIVEAEEDSQSSVVNINKAKEPELLKLPGIGPLLASKIIEYREENGKFSSIQDLKKVNGIGDSKYNNIKDLITIK